MAKQTQLCQLCHHCGNDGMPTTTLGPSQGTYVACGSSPPRRTPTVVEEKNMWGPYLHLEDQVLLKARVLR